MMYGLIYIVIALLLAFGTIWAEANGDSRVIEDREDGFFFILLISIWPITILLIITAFTLENYKVKVKLKVRDTLETIKRDPTTMGQFSVKQLKYVLFAAKIEAIVIDDKLKERVKHNILDRSFEDFMLSGKSETREK